MSLGQICLVFLQVEYFIVVVFNLCYVTFHYFIYKLIEINTNYGIKSKNRSLENFKDFKNLRRLQKLSMLIKLFKVEEQGFIDKYIKLCFYV